ncbi:MAG: molybdopterin-guanine dinucleotide biosynthesis protein B [Nitrospinota bacterium]
MIPILTIVGKSDSGKTTLIEKLVPELSCRGYGVATVKHDVHGFEVDREGKDSWRHKKAGAVATLIASSSQLALIQDVGEDPSLESLRANYIRGVDIILAEGYKRTHHPKVEVHRKALRRGLLATKEEGLLAVVTDEPFEVGVPCFELDDIGGLADFIERELILPSRRGQERLSLRVDGEFIPLKPFVERFLREALKGMLSSLRGCEKGGKVEIEIG